MSFLPSSTTSLLVLVGYRCQQKRIIRMARNLNASKWKDFWQRNGWAGENWKNQECIQIYKNPRKILNQIIVYLDAWLDSRVLSGHSVYTCKQGTCWIFLQVGALIFCYRWPFLVIWNLAALQVVIVHQ